MHPIALLLIATNQPHALLHCFTSCCDDAQLNELFEEVVREAEASGATSDAETFADFVADHLPPNYLDVLVDDMNASLPEIWEGECGSRAVGDARVCVA